MRVIPELRGDELVIDTGAPRHASSGRDAATEIRVWSHARAVVSSSKRSGRVYRVNGVRRIRRSRSSSREGLVDDPSYSRRNRRSAR